MFHRIDAIPIKNEVLLKDGTVRPFLPKALLEAKMKARDRKAARAARSAERISTTAALVSPNAADHPLDRPKCPIPKAGAAGACRAMERFCAVAFLLEHAQNLPRTTVPTNYKIPEFVTLQIPTSAVDRFFPGDLYPAVQAAHRWSCAMLLESGDKRT